MPLADRASSPALRWLPWLVGLAFALAFVPLGYLDGSARLLRQPGGDLLQHQAGILAYLRDPWHWPPFHTRLLDAPAGAALVFLDALPGPSFLAKLVLSLTGLEIPLLGWWIFATYLLQPVAMARLLGACGVARPLPILAGSLVALSCSWFLWRFGHSALAAHWLLLWSLACAVECGAGDAPGRPLRHLGLLAVGCLLVHAYLFAMAATLFLALLAGSALRRRLGWRPALAGLALWLAAAGGVMALLGYFAFSRPLWGYGHFGMNLLSPFVPQMSGLWPDFGRLLWTPDRPAMGDAWEIRDLMPLSGAGDMLDATGGQYEGYAWFGFGLWPLLLLALWLRRAALPRLLARHWPLLLAALGMALFALSPRIWVAYGPWLWVDLFPEPLQGFRSNGRFVWPLVYLGAAAAVAGVAAAAGRRWVAGALLLLTLVQLADARLLHDRLWHLLRAEPPLLLEAALWQPLIARHDRVISHSKLGCDGHDWTAVREAAFHAASVGRPIDDTQLSRVRERNCGREALTLVGLRPPPRSLLLLTGAFAGFQAALLPDAVEATCRRFARGLACSDLWDELEAAGLAAGFQPR